MSRTYWLVVQTDTGHQHIQNFSQGVVTIGRAVGNDMVVNYRNVSRTHARIRQVDDQIVIEDSNSAGGTFVNGTRVTASTPLNDGDTVQLGVTVQLRVFTSRESLNAVVAADEYDDDDIAQANTIIGEYGIDAPPTAAVEDALDSDDATEMSRPDVADPFNPFDDTPASVPDLTDLASSDPFRAPAPSEPPQPVSAAPAPPLPLQAPLDSEEAAPLPSRPEPETAPVPLLDTSPVMNVSAEHLRGLGILEPAAAALDDNLLEPARAVRPGQRVYCVGRFRLLDPNDPDPTYRSFVQCARCDALYHRVTFQSLKRCVRCGSELAKPVRILPPKPRKPAEKKQPILPSVELYRPPVTAAAAPARPAPSSAPARPMPSPAPAPSAAPAPYAVAPARPAPSLPYYTPPAVVQRPSLSPVVAFVLDNVIRAILLVGIVPAGTALSMLWSTRQPLEQFGRMLSYLPGQPAFAFILPAIAALAGMFVFYPPRLPNDRDEPSFWRRLVRFVAAGEILIAAMLLINMWQRSLSIQDAVEQPEIVLRIAFDTLSVMYVMCSLAVVLLSTIIYRLVRPRRMLLPLVQYSRFVAFCWFHLVVIGLIVVCGVLAGIVGYVGYQNVFPRVSIQTFIDLPGVLNLRELHIPITTLTVPAMACAALLVTIIYLPPQWSKWTNPLRNWRILAFLVICGLIYAGYQDVPPMQVNQLAAVGSVAAGLAFLALPVQRAFS